MNTNPIYFSSADKKKIFELESEIEKLKAMLPSEVHTEKYTIQNYPDYPDGRKNIIWIENEIGEGMGLCLDEVWEKDF